MKKHYDKHTFIENYGSIIEEITYSSAGLRNILITSSEPEEGKTTTSIGLALTAAFMKPNKQIYLVEFNFRTPVIQRLLNLKSKYGVKDLLIDGYFHNLEPFEKFLVPNLKIISAGTIPVDLPDIFDEKSISDFLDHMKNRAELNFYDSSAINRHIDSRILAKKMDGTLIVARSQRSKVNELVTAKTRIEEYGGKIIGLILNDYKDPIPFSFSRLF